MSKIVRVEIELANLPPLVERTNSVRTMSLQETPLVRIVDADGIVGVGYSWTHGAGGSSLVALLRDHLAPRLLGQEADRIEAIWQDLFRATHALAIGPVTSLAIAAIDVALWDLKGKRSGQSLWRMAGGAKQKLPAYTTDGGWLQFDVPTMVANAERTREQSFRGTKLKVGKPTLAEDLARLRAVRKALGDDFDLMVDANQCFSISEGVRRTRAFEECNLSWIEEPFPAEDVQGHAQLRAGTSIPVANGESLYHPGQFRDYFARAACSITQPDIARVGGITPWLKVAHMAEAFNIVVCPHYLMELSLSLACAIPNGAWLEYIPQLELITESRIEVRDGSALVWDRPGTGIVWDEKAIVRYRAFDPIVVKGH